MMLLERWRRRRRLARERAEVGPGGWTCHFCGSYRPDAAIGVVSRERLLGRGVPMTENRRYCRDRVVCVEQAKEWQSCVVISPVSGR